MVLFGRALVLTLSIASWLQHRTLNPLAQTLYPAGIDFTDSTVDLWAFPAQIHEDLWGPGLQLNSVDP